MADQDAHALERTSPKGEAFIGRCFKCGRDGLTSPFEDLPCANPGGMSQDDALIAAIEGDEQ